MPPPLPGRDGEIARLGALLADPGARGALVWGEAGVGKTALIEHALRTHLRAEPEPVRWIRFPPGRFTEPGYGLRQLAAALGPDGDGIAARLEAGGERSAIFTAADAALPALPHRLLVLDDLHEGDDLTLRWLARGGAALDRGQVRVLLVARAVGRLPEQLAQLVSALPGLATLELHGLDENGVRAAATAHGLRVDRALVKALHEASDGLPLALVALMDRLPPDALPADVRRVAGPEADPLPVITTAVREALLGLSDLARTLVGLAAVGPQPAAEHRLRVAVAHEPEQIDRALDEAVAGGLMVVAGGHVGFRHELQRTAVLGLLPRADRRAAARRLAEVLSAEPAAPAHAVAGLLLEAGDVEDGAAWLERAAEEAAATADHGAAFAHLQTAVSLPVPRSAGDRVQLVERCVSAARAAGTPAAAAPLVDDALAGVQDPGLQGRLQLCRAGLAVADMAVRRRLNALRQARSAFAVAGDQVREAIALGSLAVPLDNLLSLDERAAFGTQGLALADAHGDPFARAVCASSLASVQLARGLTAEAFGLWARALDALDLGHAAPGSPPLLLGFGIRGTWAAGALAVGAHREARTVIDAGAAAASGRPPDLRWQRSFAVLRLLLGWRVGPWEPGPAELEGSDLPPHEQALVALVRQLLAAEHDRADAAEILAVRDELLRAADWPWAATAQALLIRVRAARREPRPARGLLPFVERIASAGVHAGWDDVLPAAAAHDPAGCRRALALLGGLEPVGPRGEAASRWAHTLLGLEAGELDERDASTRLLDVAERYDALGEPYPAAGARAAAVAAGGLSAGLVAEQAQRAAQAFDALGARRSLARLLRAKPRLRGLAPFRAERPLVADAARLTPRERQVAQLAQRGLTAAEMALELTLSVRTVEKHLERVRSKLGVSRKHEIVRVLADDPVPGA